LDINQLIKKYGGITALSIPYIKIPSNLYYEMDFRANSDEEGEAGEKEYINSDYIELEAGLYQGESLERIKDTFINYVNHSESYHPFVLWTDQYVISSEEFHNNIRLYQINKRNPSSVY